ncbi:MAG: YncE family protein [Bacteroidetes bacterium]|nr:YncE family protein [Bacteroidota bacterium]
MAAACITPWTGFAQHGFQLLKKSVIGGEGGWDYLSVDAQNQRLYVSHGTQVEVLNAVTHEKVGAISGLQGVHGVIAVPEAGRGITTNGRSNTATIFDLKTLKPIVELPTGKNPDALLYDSFSKRVFIFNHSDVTTTAIDIAQGKVVGTVEVGGTALEAGVSDEQGTIFVNLEDTHEIVSFDAKTLAIKNKWKIAPGEEPTGLAIDVKTHRLFSVCHNGWMMVVNSDNGTLVAQLPIGKRVDGVVFDPVLKLAISSNGEGSMTVVKEISANEFNVVETVKTQAGARTIALDAATHHVFVSTANYGETPPATAENPNPRPKVIPGTFMVMEFGMK